MRAARNGDPAAAPRIVAQLNRLPLAQLTRSDLLAVLYAYELCLASSGVLDETLQQDVARRLEPMYPSTDARVNRIVSQLLGTLKVASVVPKTLARLAAASTSIQRLPVDRLRTCATKEYAGWASNLSLAEG